MTQTHWKTRAFYVLIFLCAAEMGQYILDVVSKTYQIFPGNFSNLFQFSYNSKKQHQKWNKHPRVLLSQWRWRKKEGKKRRDRNQPLGSRATKRGSVICIRQDDYEPADALKEDRVSKGASAADRVLGRDLLSAGRHSHKNRSLLLKSEHGAEFPIVPFVCA